MTKPTAPAGGADAHQPAHVQAFHRGNELRDAKRLDEAVASYDQAIALRPGYVEALNNRGNVLKDLGRFEDALASYDQAIILKPDHAYLHNNRGTVLRDRGRLDEALASFDRAIAITPDYVKALNNRGSLLKDLGRLEDAIASYDQAVLHKPDYIEALNNRGNILRELRRGLEAVASYDKAIALKPDYAYLHNNRGSALRDLKRLDDAVASYDRAIALKPDYTLAHVNRGNVLLEQGRLDDAALAAEAAARTGGGASPPHFSLGLLLARCNRKDSAVRHLLQYLEGDPQDNEGARLILAGLGAEPLPEKASESHLLGIYAERARHWGQARTTYRGHKLVSGTITRLLPGATGLDILDAGCGTGLVGGLMRSIARRLDGIDLSAPMLGRARAENIYDALHQGDLIAFLNANPGSYDVVVSAATLIHFGDLRPVFTAAARSLRDNGLFVVTLFPNGGPDNCEVAVAPLGGLAEGGCYRHGRGYVTKVAAEAGFSVAIIETDVHEIDKNGKPTEGLVVALRRNSANAS